MGTWDEQMDSIFADSKFGFCFLSSSDIYDRQLRTRLMLSGSLVKKGLFKSGHRHTGGLDVPAEPRAARARVHPSDISHRSYIAGELCPSSSLFSTTYLADI